MMPNDPMNVLMRLSNQIAQRQGVDPAHSYVSSLLARGVDHLARKVAEEAIEVVLATKSLESDQVIKETADLWFHSLVLLRHYGVGVEAVLTVLAEREGLSGLVEKASRSDQVKI